jgi:hypothetical protein
MKRVIFDIDGNILYSGDYLILLNKSLYLNNDNEEDESVYGIPYYPIFKVEFNKYGQTTIEEFGVGDSDYGEYLQRSDKRILIIDKNWVENVFKNSVCLGNEISEKEIIKKYWQYK